MRCLGLCWACVLIVSGCGGGDEASQPAGCGADTDCRGDRICENSICVDPEDRQSAAGTDGSGGDSDGEGEGDAQEPAGGNGGGAGGSGGGGSSVTVGSDGVIDDPALEEACMRDCEARHAADCEMPIGSLDQCRGQCLIVDEVQNGYCLDERREHYDCLADGGYTCVSGYPQPQSTCIAQSQALAMCNQESPCRSYCDAIDGMSCAPEGDCFESCRADEQGFEEAICGVYYTQLVSCWGQQPSCEGDRPSIAGCERQVAQVADCIGLRTGECEGFCWAAGMLGCAAQDCVEQCTPKLEDAACGYRYRRLLDCSYESYDGLYLECVDGEPTPTSGCQSEAMEYDSCMQSAAGN